ncbi:MAG: Cytochrome c [Pedosphaera sp.]|nr:Cytochrome c [Pedosphaera sp.]
MFGLNVSIAGADFTTYQCAVKAGAYDLGPVIAFSVKAGPGKTDQVINKALSIRVGKDSPADVCFDTETLRYAVGWTGGALDFSKSSIRNERGNGPIPVQGEVKFQTKIGPGWAQNGGFTDPRAGGLGPLLREWAKFRGAYRHGEQTVLSYTVGSAEVLDLPGFEASEGLPVFTRTLAVKNVDAPLTVLIAELENAHASGSMAFSASSGTAKGGTAAGQIAWAESGTNTTAVGVVGAPAEARLELANSGRILLHLPRMKAAATFEIVIWTGPKEKLGVFEERLKARKGGIDPETLCHGGPANWSETVTTSGKAGTGGGYVLDTLGLPEKNPWNSWMRLSAFDFFPDGRAAVSTLSGDVWVVSGIDDKLQKLTWRRFATGLYEPLGLKIVNGVVHVLGRDQITRLHDLNGDGEADFYENFNNDNVLAPIYHAFVFDLQTDSAGNFYYVAGGNLVSPDLPDHSAVMRVTADGKKLDVVATGFRAPNGLAIGPNDEIIVSDNEGHWTPACRINLVKAGGFYGYNGDPRSSGGRKKPVRDSYDKPACWLPMAMDNSTGDQVWAASDKWGPLGGHWISTSYGKCSLFYLMTEEVNGETQAGAVRFPFTFDSGIMRARFNPCDGQLYVCGLKGWQTSAVHDGCLQRVRYAGEAAAMPVALHVTLRTIDIGFSAALDSVTAADLQNYSLKQWNYLWSTNYGSAHYSVVDPKKKGEDELPIQGVRLSPDKRSVSLEIDNLQPVMQMQISFDLKAADGSRVTREIYNTINQAGGTKSAVP